MTRSRRSGETVEFPLKTFETVPRETPASTATSFMVDLARIASKCCWGMKRFIARHVLQLHSHVKKDGTARSRRADNELEDAVVCRSKERSNSGLEIRIPFLRHTYQSPHHCLPIR